MPKYDREQLRRMAAETLKARNAGDPRNAELVCELMRRTGKGADAIETELFILAVGP
jgi:hypothetical protein